MGKGEFGEVFKFKVNDTFFVKKEMKFSFDKEKCKDE